MTKAELTKELGLCADLGSDASAKRVLSTLIEIVTREVAAGRNVDISGLGNFVAHTQPAKDGEINGVAYSAAEKLVPKFKASKPFKRAVEGI